MRLLRMVLLGVGLGGTVGLAMHGCRPTEQTAQQGLGGAHAHFADSERGDAGDDVSNLVGAIAAPESAAQLRLKFLRLSEQTAGSGTDFQFIPGSDEVLMTLREGKLARLSLGDRRAALLDVWAFREEMLLTDAMYRLPRLYRRILADIIASVYRKEKELFTPPVKYTRRVMMRTSPLC